MLMEFQAIVMAAGTGSRMREIASAIPKCLLPVGNVPMIFCSLNILKDAGFTEVIVIVRDNEKTRIQNAIENKLELKLDFVSIPKNEDYGTADSLRLMKDKIKKDIIIIGCDIISDFCLQKMISAHRSKGSSLSVLLVPFLNSLREADMPGYKKKCKFERDIVGLDPYGKIVFINSEADFEETVALKLNILEQNREIKVHSNLVDGHVYIIKKDLHSLAFGDDHISTLKGEFLPKAVKMQFSRKAQNADSCDFNIIKSDSDWVDLKKVALELSSSEYANHLQVKIPCFSYIDRECFCLRINTLVAYTDANKRISKNFKKLMGFDIKPHQFQKSQVDGDSIVGDNCELMAKATLKQTSLGTNCKLGEKTKITGSIVMDNVSFGMNCTIQGCIICPNVKIEDNCSLKNCIIGLDQEIMSLSKLNSEVVQSSDHLMEI